MNNILSENTWIEASAGTGKTKTLIDRILLLLLHGASPNEILCITFTNAAASEMKSRLLEIVEILKNSDTEQIQTFLTNIGINKITENLIEKCKQLSEIMFSNEVKIMTIHSFCFSIINQFPIESNTFFSSKIIEEKQIKKILEQAITEVTLNEDCNPFLKKCIKFLGNSVEPYTISEILLKQIPFKGEYLRIFSEGIEKLKEKCANFFKVDVNFLNNLDLSEEYEIKFKSIEQNKQLFQDFLNAIKNNEESKQIYDSINNYFSDGKNKAENIFNIFLTKKNTPRKQILKKNILSENINLAEIINKIQNILLDTIEQQKRITSAKLSLAITLFSATVIDKYEEIKEDQKVFEYDDILIKARKILLSENSDWIKFKISLNTSHVLIDEAQDTNEIQWEIIKIITEDFYTGNSVANDRSIFVVGDVKQSIYSFQGANPKHFLEAKEYFKKKLAESSIKLKEVFQNKSYRSTNTILNFVDKTFQSPALIKALTNESKEIIHTVNRKDTSSEIEIWPIINSTSSPYPTGWEIPIYAKQSCSPYIILAKKIALMIKEKIQSKLFLPSKKRNITPEDFLILFQRRNSFIMQVIKALKKEGIPVSGIDKLDLLEHISIQDILSLARFVLFPYDNLNLACLLKSPFCNISEKNLLSLCKDISFDNTILDNIKNFNEKLYQKLMHWIEISKKYTIYDFFYTILEKEKFKKRLAERSGIETINILEEFLQNVFEFEKNEDCPTLFNFLYWIQENNLKVNSNNSIGNGVKLSTVHGAKGLQAPCVILADANFYNINVDNYIWNDILLFYPNIENATKEIISLRNQEIKKRSDEYYRLLYVALTRAQDALYITGAKFEKDLNQNCWYKILLNTFEKIEHKKINNKNFNDQILRIDGLRKIKNKYNILEPKGEPINIVLDKLNLPLTNNNLCVKSTEIDTGIFIHELLANYFSNNKDEFIEFLKSSLKTNKYNLSENDINEVEKIIFNIINSNNLNWVFAENSYPEISFISKTNRKEALEGRIDRIIINKDHSIDLIDIKTSPVKPKLIPYNILKQLRFYSNFLKTTYKHQYIRTSILWTCDCSLQKVPNKLLFLPKKEKIDNI